MEYLPCPTEKPSPTFDSVSSEAIHAHHIRTQAVPTYFQPSFALNYFSHGEVTSDIDPATPWLPAMQSLLEPTQKQYEEVGN
ncbi:hypothetical protein LTR10_023246 [Elasticomyces elasticus]|uniref:Uncharacterized protein n=1 Tax=Exophiala sideris TaxID=1016849 RepID=A0ABR0J2B2_9EURO|nr:hypothetical protein LTR10_023246 [Elasticomyces elasticus]KAK5024738.1 hypothetical protein LTS07_008584 [Exophiala sideris]KAK5030831.1 hypothetical protein LTR13_008185 [Exophiala sideris]KAK5054373.1 hypothetical protein LTR69_008988 [Exophiala sideris]KAK5179773.1 hypothetical protein LTR44_007941 [Eurotiomycetes sp. CCFEE 6388]